MADAIQLNRINKFFGGITDVDKDITEGVCLNMEDMDIFTNAGYMQTATKFLNDDGINLSQRNSSILGYTLGDEYNLNPNGVLYAIDSAGLYPRIRRKISADSTSPNEWVSVIETTEFGYQNAWSPIAWHRVHYEAGGPLDTATVEKYNLNPATAAGPLTRIGSTATFRCLFKHGVRIESKVALTVSGAHNFQYNGVFEGTAVSSTEFTYTVDPNNAPATPDPGTSISASVAFLYYVSGGANTARNKLIRVQIPSSLSEAWYASNQFFGRPKNAPEITEDTTAAEKLKIEQDTYAGIYDQSVSLDGLNGINDRIPMFRHLGDLYIGHGRFIEQVTRTGNVITHSFTIPSGWEIVSMTAQGQSMLILCRSVIKGHNQSMVFYWDLTNPEGVVDQAAIPHGGAQIIANLNETIWAICCINGMFQSYSITDKYPKPIHFLENIALETDGNPIIPDATKFVKENVLYFGLRKTDKSGLYAIGQVMPGKPFALVLAKRFDSTDYSKHVPYSAACVGDNFYASFTDDGQFSAKKVEGNAQIRTNNGVYESIWLDLGTPETIKDWLGFMIGMRPLPIGCSMYVDARTDNNTRTDLTHDGGWDLGSNRELTRDNDQAGETESYKDGVTGDTYWFRSWESLRGRMVQFRIRFFNTSNQIAPVRIYYVSLLSRENNLI